MVREEQSSGRPEVSKARQTEGPAQVGASSFIIKPARAAIAAARRTKLAIYGRFSGRACP
jgi:hypothetical protein